MNETRRRPEWIKCIATSRGKSYCGSVGGWMFVDLSHADATVQNEGRLVPCPNCIAVARREHSSTGESEP